MSLVSVGCVLSPEVVTNDVVAIRSTMGWCKVSADSCVKSLGESYTVWGVSQNHRMV